MTKEEKIAELEILKIKAVSIKRESDYYNSLQLALKLILNGSYGAFSTFYFILFHYQTGSSITSMGRCLTQYMTKCNEEYWYKLWHEDIELHKNLCIKNVKKIKDTVPVSIYADTDSLFVGMEPAIKNCEWQNILFDNLNKLKRKFIIILSEINTEEDVSIDTSSVENCLGKFDFSTMEDNILSHINVYEDLLIIVDGHLIKNRDFQSFLKKNNLEGKLKWNWSDALDFIQGIDYYRYAGYFKLKLEEFAASYGVVNREDFELERISESAIHVAKKKYMHHILMEDGINYDKFSYLYYKGIELVRRSTPLFAREKIVDIIKYLFTNPDTFNIKELLKLVKNLRKEFDLCVPDKIDDISMQSSCSNYESYVLQDNGKLKFANKAPASVKAAAYYNYLLHNNKQMQGKYEFLKSGSKVKYYYCKDTSVNKIFAFYRGAYPIEFGPEIDLTTQFAKAILSPINAIIAPLKLPEITERLSVVMSIFGDTLKKKDVIVDETDDLEEGSIFDFEEKDDYEVDDYYQDYDGVNVIEEG